jgi:triosephosphate isomerase (TIM)
MERRRKLIAGNWKMFTTLPEALELVTELKRLVSMARQVDIAVIPPALFVEPVARRLAESNIGVGVQNIYSADFGAFTGELSSQMLRGMDLSYCLAGHSERRQFFGDTDEVVNSKVKAIFAQSVTPIFCIGESLAEREGEQTFAVLGRQLAGGLAGIDAQQASSIVVAYEPVWAIGTGLTASAEQVAEVHAWLRGWLAENYGKEVAEHIRIQYGGSVKPENAAELLHTPNVDGALVGGAALKADSFAKIVKAGF